MKKPIVVQPGATISKINMDDYKDSFLFLYDEWISADAYLEMLGVPAQVTVEEDVVETRSLEERIRILFDERTTS